jgi:hypothetical protein
MKTKITSAQDRGRKQYPWRLTEGVEREEGFLRSMSVYVLGPCEVILLNSPTHSKVDISPILLRLTEMKYVPKISQLVGN